MEIVVLDAATLGEDISLLPLEKTGSTVIYKTTLKEEVKNRIQTADVVVLNKVVLNEENLKYAKNLKLICITATGYDNVDVSYCQKRGIAVCNVKGYSTDSVSQVTIAMVLSLITHVKEYRDYVKSGQYTKSGLHNYLKPVYHEISSMTWGVIGLGNIGRKTAKIAKAFGCSVICSKRTPDTEFETVDIDTLIEKSDIITVHVPLNNETKNLINKDRIAKMKKTAVFVNVARGAVADEAALAAAIKQKRLGAIGIDVYEKEPLCENHPYYDIINYDNVCLMPHMAWGAHEARERCIKEIAENIKAFFAGEIRNRVDLI